MTIFSKFFECDDALTQLLPNPPKLIYYTYSKPKSLKFSKVSMAVLGHKRVRVKYSHTRVIKLRKMLFTNIKIAD